MCQRCCTAPLRRYAAPKPISAATGLQPSFQPFSKSYCTFITDSNSNRTNQEGDISLAVEILLNLVIASVNFFDYFDDVRLIYVLASINHDFNDRINGCDDIWRNLFNSIIRVHSIYKEKSCKMMNAYTIAFKSYPYHDEYDKLYYILPNIESNESYRDNFPACYKKMRFVEHITQNIGDSNFVEFYSNFLKCRLSVNSFGAKRYFSRNEMIVIVKFSSSGGVSNDIISHRFDYYDLDNIRIQSAKIDECSISPNIVLQTLFNHSISAMLGVIFFLGDTCDNGGSFVSFYDIAISVDKLNILFPIKSNDGDNNSCDDNKTSQPLTYFQHAPIGAETPFECYLCY